MLVDEWRRDGLRGFELLEERLAKSLSLLLREGILEILGKK